MMNVLITIVAIAMAGCAAMQGHNTAHTLEFRPASLSPEPGFAEMAVPGTERPVYVSDDVLLSNQDIKSARVVSGPNGPEIEILFTKAGAQRFTDATEQSINKPLAILLDGKLLSAPVVRQKITGGRAVINGHFTEQEARQIANGILGN